MNDTKMLKTLLHFCENNDIANAKKLNVQGFDFTKIVHLGMTLLHWAALHESWDMIDFIREQPGVDMNMRDSCGKTVLHYLENEYIVDDLVHRGADITVQDNRGLFPIHTAAYCNSAIIYMLIVNKASASVVDFAGNTPLHYLCGGWRNERLFFVNFHLLIQAQGNPETRNNEEKTAFDLCGEGAKLKTLWEQFQRKLPGGKTQLSVNAQYLARDWYEFNNDDEQVSLQPLILVCEKPPFDLEYLRQETNLQWICKRIQPGETLSLYDVPELALISPMHSRSPMGRLSKLWCVVTDTEHRPWMFKPDVIFNPPHVIKNQTPAWFVGNRCFFVYICFSVK